jgi:hypothetical protein
MIKGFLFGFAAGAVTIWVVGESIVAVLDERTRAVRARLARRLRVTADVLERGSAPAPGLPKAAVPADAWATRPMGTSMNS